MPTRKPPAPAASPSTKPQPARGTFRQRYDDLEARRTELVARLRKLGQKAESHPSYKRALKLLNDTFRKSKLAQRLAVLQAAAWLIDLLERLTMSL
jgi:predicted RNA polymerase sigma factor